ARAEVFDGDGGSVEGDAVDETPGSVDGVEDPAVGGGAGLLAELLAEDGVVGEGSGNQFTEAALSGPVGRCEGAAVGVVLDGEGVRVEIVEREAAGFARRGQGEVEAGAEFSGGRWRSSGRGHERRVAGGRTSRLDASG